MFSVFFLSDEKINDFLLTVEMKIIYIHSVSILVGGLLTLCRDVPG